MRAENFADGGGIGERTLRGVRRGPLEEFADLPDTPFAEMFFEERLKADRRARAGAGRPAVHAKNRVHVLAEQPGEDRALVSRGGALGSAVGVFRLEGFVLQRQRSRPWRREQPFLERRQDARRLPPFQQVAG